MCKRDYKIADFVLDPEFQKWVLFPDGQTKCYWEKYIQENPKKEEDIAVAVKLVVNMSRKTNKVTHQRIEDTWSNIENAIDNIKVNEKDSKTVPLNSDSTILHFRQYGKKAKKKDSQFYNIAAVLAITFSLSILATLYLPREETQVLVEKVAMKNHYAPPGVKANLTLQDGTKVILNSGSSIKYIENFENHKRELELSGEAYFDVAEDKRRPFIVKTGAVTTTALGTSFLISSYENKPLDIALLTGKVAVNIGFIHPKEIRLTKGEGIKVDLKSEKVQNEFFDPEKILAWTKKTIIFEKVSMFEVKSVLENWYGVKIEFKNQPSTDLEISGKFSNQSLENVLEGLSHSARFQFELGKDKTYLKFN